MDERFLRTIRQAVGNNFRVEVRGGKPMIKLGMDWVPLAEGWKRIQETAISGSQHFGPTMGPATFPSSGAGFYGQLEELAKSAGMDVEVIRHRTKDVKGLRATLEQEYGKEMFPIIRGDSTAVIRMRTRSGRKLSFNEIRDTMLKNEGLSIFAEGNPTKRLSDVISSREISGFFDDGNALKAAIYDPTKVPMASGKARMAEEGIWTMPPRTVRKIARQLDERAKIIEQQVKAGTLSDEAAYSAKAHALAVRRKAKEARDIAKKGGRFNIRFAGVEGFDVSDILDPKSLGLLGQGKGDVLVTKSNKAFDEVVGKGYDVAGSFSGNTKSELGRVRTQAGKIRSTISLQTHHIQDMVRMNAQAFLANPDLYDIDQMEKFTQSKIDQFFEMVVKRGELPKGMIADFEEMLYKTPGPGVSMHEFKRQQAFARRALSAVKGGTLTEDPTLLRQIFKNYRGFLTKGQDKGAFFFVPDTLGAHITPFEMAQRFGLTPKSSLRPGQITFIENVGWAMRGVDAVDISPALGGSDMDDLLQNAIRYDQVSKKLRVAVQRPPTAYGEIGAFDIDIDDPGVKRVLRTHLGDDEFDRLDLDRLFLPGYKDELESFVGKTITPFDAMEDIVARDISKADQAAEVWIKNSEDIQAGLDEKVAKHAAAVMDAATLGVGAGKKKKYTLEAALSSADILDETKFQLETYSNARMLADFMKNAYRDELDVLSASGELVDDVRVLQQETVIDEMIEAAMTDSTKIPTIRDDMLRAIGRTSARHGLKLDPLLFASRNDGWGGRMNAEAASIILGGAQEVDSSIENISSLMMDETDDKAFYSRAVNKFRDTLKFFDEDSSYSAKKAKFFDSIYFDKTAQKDAERLHVAYTLAKEKWDVRTATDLETAQDAFKEYGDTIDLDHAKKAAKVGVENDTAKMLATMFDDDGTMGDRARKAVAAYLQAYGEDKDIFTGTLTGVKDTVMSWYKTGGLDKDTLSEMTQAQREHLVKSARQKITLEDLFEEAAGSEFKDISKTVDEYIAKDEIPGATRMGQKAADYANAAATAARGGFENVSVEGLKRLWDIPSVRKGTIGGALAIVGSFMYQATKGDRTPQDMQGPPLLPGGSAYETDYYNGELPPGVGNNYTSPSMSGVTYRVNVRGSYDPEVLRNRLEGITGASASGTIYNVPNPESDIFDVLNQSYG